jgi:hypothetical protein
MLFELPWLVNRDEFMAIKSSISYHYYSLFLAILLFAFSVLSIGSYVFYLEEYAESFEGAFRFQNLGSLEAGDIFKVAEQLEHLKKSDSVSCMFASYKGQRFYGALGERCEGGVFSRLVKLAPNGNQDIRIDFVVKLPRKVEFAFLGFAVCNLLMAFFLVWTVLLFEKSKNESQLKIAEMARGMAHDIRSPLSALEMTVASIDLPERSKKIILGATGKIGGLARDLLEHSKAIRSNISDKAIRESVNLSQVISVAVEEKIELNREVSFVLNLGVGGVIAEKYHLERIISNILDNSIESRRENEKLEIKVSSKVNGRKVNLYIRDNGVGIEHSVMSKIGNEGFSVGKKNGNGLGLYMAKKKIKEWGGDFSISSNQDAGTLVVLTLLSDNKIPQG